VATDDDRIQEALARRAEQERDAPSHRAEEEARLKREQSQIEEWARQFAAVVVPAVQETAEALNRGALPTAPEGLSIEATTATPPSRTGAQVPSQTYVIKKAGGGLSAKMLVFEHDWGTVVVTTKPNPQYRGLRPSQYGERFEPRSVLISQFTLAVAKTAFADFIKIALPTLPL
jgi:hypothetical protein